MLLLPANVNFLVKLGILMCLYVSSLAMYSGPGYPTWFFWHPVMALTSVLPFASMAIVFKQHNKGIPNNAPNRHHPQWHNYLMLMSLAAMWGAVYVIYTNKDMNEKPHFTTWHGQIGLVVLFIWTNLSLVATFALWDYPKNVPVAITSVLRRVGAKIKYVAAFHRLAGRSAYFLTLYLLISGWWKLHQAGQIAHSYAYLFGVPAVLVII